MRVGDLGRQCLEECLEIAGLAQGFVVHSAFNLTVNHGSAAGTSAGSLARAQRHLAHQQRNLR